MMTRIPLFPITTGQPSGPAPDFTWRVWPLRDNLWGTGAAVLGIMALTLSTWLVTRDVRLAMVAAGAMTAALARVFLHVSYTVGRRGITQRTLGLERTIPWRRVGSYAIRASGLVLFRVADPLPIDALRGFYIPWGSHRREILEEVRRYMGKARYVGGSSDLSIVIKSDPEPPS